MSITRLLIAFKQQAERIYLSFMSSVNTFAAKVEVVQLKDYKKAGKTLAIAFKEDPYGKFLMENEDPASKEEISLALDEGNVYMTIQNGLVVGVRDVELEKEDPDCPFLAVALFEKPEKDPEDEGLLSKWLWWYNNGYARFIWLAKKATRQRVLVQQVNDLDVIRKEVLGDQAQKSWYLADIGAIPRGRGKGLARRLVDYACRNYIDVASPDYIDEPAPEHFRESDFEPGSDNYTDYSGYSSDSDTSSAHSSWYNEDTDLLAQYDQKRGHVVGAPLYLESSHPRNRRIYQKLGFTYVKTINTPQSGGHVVDTKLDLMVRGPGGTKWLV